jgi:hypothetical protein
MFQWKKAVAAGALALACAAPALALPPGTAVQVTVNISGASASDAFIGNLITQLCSVSANDLTTFLDDTNANGVDDGLGIDGSSYQAYSCTLDSSKIPGIGLTNPTALILKRSAGGSGIGVAPVCNGTSVAMMAVTAQNCVDGGGPANRFVCGAATTSVIPEGGVSDVSPSEVGGGTASTNCDVVKSTFGTGFSAIATTRLRNALQAAQGLTVGSDTAANMPSISKGQLMSIATGRIQNWRQFMVNGVDLVTAATNAGLAAPSSDVVTACRRVETSGTTAAFKLRILGSPSGLRNCENGAQELRYPGLPDTGPYVLTEQSSATDEGNCVANQDVVNPPQYQADPTDPTFLVDTSNWAIGLQQSTEENAGLTRSYRFLRVDGVLPTIDNMANGTWRWWTESTLQYRSSFPSTAQKAILNEIALEGATPTAVATANVAALHTWGQGGKVALAAAGCNVDPNNNNLWETSAPCSGWANTFSGATNNCTGPYIKAGVETVLGPNEDNLLTGDGNNPP